MQSTITEGSQAPSPQSAERVPGRSVGADSVSCPDCERKLEVPHGTGTEFVACPVCAQVISGPLRIGRTNWDLVLPQWPISHTQYSATVTLGLGVGIAMLSLVPFFGLYAKAAAILVGLGVICEGLGRAFEDKFRQQESVSALSLPPVNPVQDLGELKAVFATKNSLFDSFALCMIAGALACGLLWGVDFMVGAAGQGRISVKGILAAIVGPLIVGYAIYRAVQLRLDRKAVFVFEHGVCWTRRGKTKSAHWQDIHAVSAIHLGDAIDQDAIELTMKSLKKHRFTRGEYTLFERMWQHLIQQMEPYISSGQLKLQVHQSPPAK